MTSKASLITAPSTHPPLTEPAISPLDDTASFAPSRLGAVPTTRTTVARATVCPSACQRSIAGIISVKRVSVSIGLLYINFGFWVSMSSPKSKVQNPKMGALSDHSIAIIILAAGRGQRMGLAGGSKLLLPLSDGQPIIMHTIRNAVGLQPAELIVVTRPDLPELADAIV